MQTLIKIKDWSYLYILKSNIQNEVIILNIYGPNHRASQYEAQLIELKGEIEESKVTVGDFNTPLSVINRTSRQKFSNYIEDMNNIFNPHNLFAIYKYSTK